MDVGSPRSELLSALSSLQVGGKYSDLVVRCNSRRWAVHRAIVCSRSGFFDSACSSDFAEAQSGIIDLSEDDEDEVDHMIDYFYRLDYAKPREADSTSAVFRHNQLSLSHRHCKNKTLDLSAIEDPLVAQAAAQQLQPAGATQKRHDSATSFDMLPAIPQNKRSRSPSFTSSVGDDDVLVISDDESNHDDDDQEYENQLMMHTRIYALAEKYEIPSLKNLARSKFEQAMACHYDAPDFADAMEEVYCSTPAYDRGLRDVVIQAFCHHPQLACTSDVLRVIKVTPDLAQDLWKVERGIPIMA